MTSTLNGCMKRLIRAATILLGVGTVLAHQPRIIGDKLMIEIRNPEISQAFYARLAGAPQTYTIRSGIPLRLYVNILVPDIPGIDTDYEAVIFRESGGQREILARLDGNDYEWRPFFEPFGGDRYKLGPEFDEQQPAGTYLIVVSSPDNRGRYALAVGKIEKFPPLEMARTIAALPKLKRYFGKSPWTAFFNLSGAFLLVVILALAVPIVFVVRRRRRS